MSERAVAYQIGDSCLPWFALQVKPRQEKSVSNILSYKGLECFLPVCPSKRQWSDRVVQIELPLFPGYVFCRLDLLNRLPVLTTPGVLRIVGVGRTPSPVDDSEMSAVEAVVRSGVSACPWPMPQIGEWVAIERGPLAGLEGVLVTIKNRLRFVVSVTLLQRAVAVEVDAAQVRRVQRPQQMRNEARTPWTATSVGSGLGFRRTA